MRFDLTQVSNRYPDGTLLPPEQRFKQGQTITGPCGYGCEVAADHGGPYIIIEEYTGDRSAVRRDKLPPR